MAEARICNLVTHVAKKNVFCLRVYIKDQNDNWVKVRDESCKYIKYKDQSCKYLKIKIGRPNLPTVEFIGRQTE